VSQAEFDRYANDYDELLKDPLRDTFARDALFFHIRKRDIIRDFCRRRGIESTQLRWVDVGCGRGELLKIAHPLFSHASGCDVSPGMMEAGTGVETVVQTDPERLPYASESCDFVTAVCVFHHVEAPHQPSLIAEMRRILRPGGIACIIEHNPLNPVTRAIVSRTPVDANAVLLRAGETRRLLQQGSLRNLETTYFLYLPARFYAAAGGMERLLARVPLGGQYACFARLD
jgi:SAM-dependent methyltransferase